MLSFCFSSHVAAPPSLWVTLPLSLFAICSLIKYIQWNLLSPPPFSCQDFNWLSFLFLLLFSCSVVSNSATPWTVPTLLLCHGFYQARILEQVDISSSRGSFWPRNPWLLPRILHCRWVLYCWATRETSYYMSKKFFQIASAEVAAVFFFFFLVLRILVT